MINAADWFEIPTADLERACAFYERAFDCKLNVMQVGPKLRLATFPVPPFTGGVGGALAHYPDFYKPSQEGALVYLNADPDLGVVLERIVAQGGKVVVPKTQISPEYGHMAIFIDSEGNRVALHSKG